jgi:F420-dependent oxidoreductase-like protein
MSTPAFKLGLQIPRFKFPGVAPEKQFEHVVAIARAAESSGFDSVWVMDHFEQIMGNPAEPILEGYVLLGGLAARTERVHLGTLVTGVIHRNPAVLAKMVTTLDVLSGGRAILGIGAAWNDLEQQAYGIARAPVGERMDRLEEALQICRLMFTQESPSFEGRYYRIENAHNSPRPIRPEGIPVMIGGGGEKRTLRLVAQYADACNIFGDSDTVKHKMSILDSHCADVGRDPREIKRTALRTVVISRDGAEAAEKANAMRQRIGEERFRFSVIGGTPDDVRAQAEELYGAGLDGLIVNLRDAHDLEVVALTGETLSNV